MFVAVLGEGYLSGRQFEEWVNTWVSTSSFGMWGSLTGLRANAHRTRLRGGMEEILEKGYHVMVICDMGDMETGFEGHPFSKNGQRRRGMGKKLRVKRSISVSERTRPERKPELFAKALDDECILYDSNGDKVYSLNPTAAYVWNLCDGNHTLAQIVDATASAFGGSDIALVEEDIKELMAELTALDLVTLRVPLKLK